MFETGVLYKKNLDCASSVIVNQGGTSSGKTYSILQVLFTRAISEKCVITIAGQDIPNLKSGALRDAQSIVERSEVLQTKIASYNKSERIYTFTSGSVMEFKSYSNAQDAKSGKRDYLFVNEANGIPYEVYDELAMRTYKQIFIDYNPNRTFWVHDLIIPDSNTTLFISDHRHNPFLSQGTRDKIEAKRKVDYELWKVYARGLTGKIEGLIFPNCSIVDAVPSDAKLIGIGQDFGFTNDPSASIAVYMQNGELFLDELIYETGLTNPDIAKRLKEHGVDNKVDIVADSAEPKSIAELNVLGLHVIHAVKGPDSIDAGINILKRYHMNITRRSTGLRKEQQNYIWAKDKDGKTTNKPIDDFNHAWDAVRYLASRKLKLKRDAWAL